MTIEGRVWKVWVWQAFFLLHKHFTECSFHGLISNLRNNKLVFIWLIKFCANTFFSFKMDWYWIVVIPPKKNCAVRKEWNNQKTYFCTFLPRTHPNSYTINVYCCWLLLTKTQCLSCSAAQQHSTFSVQILYKLYSLQLNCTYSNYTQAAATSSRHGGTGYPEVTLRSMTSPTPTP